MPENQISLVEAMFVYGSSYSCNGSQRSPCEGERFNGCRHCRTGVWAEEESEPPTEGTEP